MTTRSLQAILAELSLAMKTLAEQHVPPISLDQELEMSDRARQRGNESLALRAIEILVFTAHASGLMALPELQLTPAYRESVEALRLSGKPLPADL